ncbi:TIGR03557 family F420-dependent LLM class oxidoreductase [Sphingomonas sp. CGMCC 1.13654]|uniref:TIGR03557 family F420-dependent LLM class oxidoreductase n=1 Tax=Sphingomonas chungangi TaxID=2683589 RepID=A0A838L600_9SPHN|nr:TIGR03557 family F420-dependent LLM class oxidoreductase [Sphingomonas chungangi]MBA2934923.1 TIGR03557 family F420-dependent LLM class oxidoreductase [Sphingomonas chungangi]MVW58234.1 TIGR03557 family F420-dependent LLM class oxidoreductase [Sphingomonas chungangi]
MVQFGYKLMTEEHGPAALIENAQRAEAAGFDFVSISDHFHPWLEAQGHAPFAWSVLGGIAQATSRIGIATGLICPIIRYHPAIIAQAAATIAVMSKGRFTLAVGAGERLNEHVTGDRWPSTPERHAMLGEAIDIFRTLWSGGVHSWSGEWYVVDHARLYDLPDDPIDVVVGVSGPASVALAIDKADGIMATEPKPGLVDGFRAEKAGPAYAEALLSYAPTRQAGLEQAHRTFRFSALGWAVNSELRDVDGFESASRFVRPEDLESSIAAGPDVDAHLAVIKTYADAGFDRIVLTCPGQEQARFIDFFEKELRPRL